jgi:2-(1,2-epoxy-1,2-dihydrophenyl)acetyl-CoA isomerase
VRGDADGDDDDDEGRGGATMPETVTREDAGGVATITMLRPGLTHLSRRELLDVVREVAADDSVRAVVLTGTGRAFCVGQDLGQHVEALRGNAATSLSVVEDEYNPLVLALAGCGCRWSWSGSTGPAPARGWASRWPVTCGWPAAGAKFTTAFAGIGLSSDSGLASRLVHCVGGSRAAELLLLPEPFRPSGRRVGAWCTGSCPPSRCWPRRRRSPCGLAAGPTAAYRAIKTVLATAATDRIEETLALEARLQTDLGRTGRPPRGRSRPSWRSALRSSPVTERTPRPLRTAGTDRRTPDGEADPGARSESRGDRLQRSGGRGGGRGGT